MKTIPPDDVGLCNCASCDCTMIGEKTRDLVLNENLSLGCKTYLPFIGGRAPDAYGHRRPYCLECLNLVRMESHGTPRRLPGIRPERLAS